MPDWCNNAVTFEGSEKAIQKIEKLFKKMTEQENEDRKGQLPDFIPLYSGYFFDLYQNEGDTGIFHYQTKWSPNIEIVQKIAEYYKVDFVQDYTEMENLIYGKATCQKGVLTDIYLENEDFEQYSYDEETECYCFEEKLWYSDLDILEILLERKIKKQKSTP